MPRIFNAVDAERERCVRIIEMEADKVEEEGSPTIAMVLRKVARKIRKKTRLLMALERRNVQQD